MWLLFTIIHISGILVSTIKLQCDNRNVYLLVVLTKLKKRIKTVMCISMIKGSIQVFGFTDDVLEVCAIYICI